MAAVTFIIFVVLDKDLFFLNLLPLVLLLPVSGKISAKSHRKVIRRQ